MVIAQNHTLVFDKAVGGQNKEEEEENNLEPNNQSGNGGERRCPTPWTSKCGSGGGPSRSIFFSGLWPMMMISGEWRHSLGDNEVSLLLITLSLSSVIRVAPRRRQAYVDEEVWRIGCCGGK